MTQRERQGWIIVASLFATMVLIFGSGYNTIPVFVPTLVKAFGWKRAEVSMLPSALALSSGVTVLIVGWLVDRFEARFVIAAGAGMAGIAFLIASSANSLIVMIAAYLLLGVALSFGTVIPLSFVITNWFIQRRGLAMGIASSGSTTGAMIMTLVASLVIRHWGWRAAYLTLAVPIFFVLIPLVLVIVRSHPPGEVKMTVAQRAETLEGFETAEAFRTRSFWMIVLAQFCFALSAAGAVNHMVAHLIDSGYAAGNAALIMSFTFGFMSVGKVSLGLLADRVSARVALMLNFAGQALGLILALQVGHILILPLFVLFFGLTLAPPLMLIPLLIAESLGLRRYGALMGLTQIANTIGAVAGPLVAGRVFDVTHSYTSAFELFVAINVFGLVATFVSTRYQEERSRMAVRAAGSAKAELKAKA
jgi:MFS family permease